MVIAICKITPYTVENHHQVGNSQVNWKQQQQQLLIVTKPTINKPITKTPAIKLVTDQIKNYISRKVLATYYINRENKLYIDIE